MRGTPAEKLNLATAQNVAEVLRDHVVLELEGIDRMYLNVFVPVLQAVEGVLKFIRIHRGRPWSNRLRGASSPGLSVTSPHCPRSIIVPARARRFAADVFAGDVAFR
jgi:hypothetical protein